MPTTRKRKTRGASTQLTAAVVEAYRHGDDDALRLALGLRPWEISPLEICDGERCPYPPETAGAESWPRALELRRVLELEIAKSWT